MERTCTRCRLTKPIEDFKWRESVGRHDNLCKPCRTSYAREHYEANRARYLERASRRRREVTRERAAYIAGYLAERGCADCGENDPIVLEFDHVGEKRFTIGAALRHKNWEAILDEIERCDVVCANCHVRRTSTRGGHVRFVLGGSESG